MSSAAAPVEQSAVGGRRSADESGPILQVEGLVKRFGGIAAVNGASFDVEENSVTALIGPNGAGKTTLFNVITGFYRAERGSVLFQGQQIVRRPPHVIARLGMVRTFQITKALAKMPVIDNMMLAAPNQPGEHLYNLVLRPGGCAGARARGARARRGAARGLPARKARARVRGSALGRAAQAARVRTRPDGRAHDAAARRADGGDQPHPRRAGSWSTCTSCARSAA